jgi:hypothetical protein
MLRLPESASRGACAHSGFARHGLPVREGAGATRLVVLVAAAVLALVDVRGLTVIRPCAAQSVGSRGASFYDSDSGTIVLDGAQSPQDMALALVHEASHAKYEKEGKAAKISSDARADYVRKMLDEEVAAVAASIEVKWDLQGEGKTITTRYPLEAEYRAAYARALEELKKSRREASPAELDLAAKASAIGVLRDGFRTGKVVITHPGEKYPDYYGAAWDKKHEARRPGVDGDHSARRESSGRKDQRSGESQAERKSG